MRQVVLDELNRILGARWHGGDALEIGCMADGSNLLLTKAVTERARSRVGINPRGPWKYKGITIRKGHGSRMWEFKSGTYDLVMYSSVFEHDETFWLTLAEMRRVARPGALIIVGAPGFRRRTEGRRDPLPVFPEHRIRCSGDFWRFGWDAFKKVILCGLVKPEISVVGEMPDLIGAGNMPGGK